MKARLVVLCALCALRVSGQSHQQEINDQIWKPFISTFNNRDTDGFMVLHSRDVVRSPRDGKVVLNWDEYYKEQKHGDEQGKTSESERTLDLRFTERINSKTLAVEVGIYKTTVIRKDGIEQSFYGRFHVILRKENNVWKILVDTDSSEGGSIGEKHFLEVMAME